MEAAAARGEFILGGDALYPNVLHNTSAAPTAADAAQGSAPERLKRSPWSRGNGGG